MSLLLREIITGGRSIYIHQTGPGIRAKCPKHTHKGCKLSLVRERGAIDIPEIAERQ